LAVVIPIHRLGWLEHAEHFVERRVASSDRFEPVSPAMRAVLSLKGFRFDPDGHLSGLSYVLDEDGYRLYRQRT